MRVCIGVILTLSVNLTFAQPVDGDMFTHVNSVYDELNPVISPDGQLLFLTVANHPQNMGGKKDPGDIWFSSRIGNTWSAPIHAGLVLNDMTYNAVAGFSADGTQLFLLNHYDNAGRARTQGISVSKNEGNGWSRPVNISIPYFQNKSSVFSGFITPDNGVFIFSAETYGTKGVEDIYVSLNEDGKWTEPKNLGSIVNTTFQELAPSLSQDGKTLYFSSNGRKGKGSFDVYSSVRLDDSWSNWSEPVNLGTTINTEGRELFYREYADPAFSIFTTTKNSDGYGDVKLYTPTNTPIKKDTASVTVQLNPDTSIRINEIVREKALNREIRVHGKVNNSKTAESVQATLNFSSQAMHRDVKTGAQGYSIEIPSTEVYTIRIEANGYVSTIEKLDVHTYEMNDLELNFKLQPIEIGARVSLKSVLFERGTATLLPESDPELDVVVSFLKANPNIKIELVGHTDNRGVQEDNVKLSQQRVNKVKEYLVLKGVAPKRITGRGYGGSRPIASNETEDTRKFNRRVEFTIKKF